MSRSIWFLIAVLSILGVRGIAWADDDDEKQVLSGQISAEGGSFQSAGSGLAAYQYSRLSLETHQDILEGLSFGMEGEAVWQSSGIPMPPTQNDIGAENLIKLEANNYPSDEDDGGTDIASLQLEQAFLHWASGRLDLTAGLFKANWGSSYFYRPTDYFFPLAPLQWKGEEANGSEGLDASCFLFDDLSLEGAARWLEGGAAEGVLKVVDKGIGITVTPSLAWMTGRNGLGLELVGTFPTLQARFEAVDWLYADNHTAVNWTLGLSTLNEGVKYTAEILRDDTGEILGNFTDQAPPATYVFISAEGKFFEKWKASPAMVLPLEGGPFLFWPKVSWAFEPHWELGFQAQMLLGNWKGPLDLYPGRAGISLSYIL